MASTRPVYGLPARPSDGFRPPRRASDTGAPSNVPRPLNLRSKSNTEAPKVTTDTQPKSRLPSRVPQPSSTSQQQPSRLKPRSRYPEHQSNSSGSSRTTDSAQSNSHSQTGSNSSASSRSQEGNLKSARNLYYRKPSSQDSNNPWDDSPRTSSTSSIPRTGMPMYETALGIQFDRTMTGSPAEILLADLGEMVKPVGTSPVIYPELDRYRNIPRPIYSPDEQSINVPFRLATQDLPPLTPGSMVFSGSSQVSASPSTRFSESPGPGPYSRDTTPTSMSSQSPGIAAPSRFTAARGRQNSPAHTRPPVTRRRGGSFSDEFNATSVDPQGLAAVRESLTSSSSNSTVKEGDKSNKREPKPTRRLAAPPPSPPPRKSSNNFPAPVQQRSSPVKTRKESQSKLASPPPLKINTTSPRPQLLSSPGSAAPRRPSRDGTPDLHSQFFGPVPIVHSNLSSTSLPGERRGSDTALPNSHSRSNTPLLSTRNASTSFLPLTKETSLTSDRSSTSPVKSTLTKLPPPIKTGARTPSPVVTSSGSRFPFFGRKKRTTEEETKAEKTDAKKSTRKGPAAGTGHEGYGRLGAIRRRSGSVSQITRGMPDKMSSQESLNANDQFLASRLNPVVIAGGEIVENRNASSELSRTESNQSLIYGRPVNGSNSNLDLHATQRAASRGTAGATRVPQTGRSRRPSDSSDSEGVTMKSNLALRRSVQRLNSAPDSPPLRIPLPIKTNSVVASPMTSFDTSVMSDESHFELRREMSRESNGPHPPPKKLMKRPQSPRKWRFFGRSRSRSISKQPDDNVAATVTPVEHKPVAFYTMIDTSDPENDEVLDIQEVLRNANVYMASPPLESTPELAPGAFSPPAQLSAPYLNDPSQLLAPVQQPEPSPVKPKPAQALPPPPLDTTMPATRRNRLPQVGRIPLVVSNRAEQGPSPISFSRPFRASVLLPSPSIEAQSEGRVYDQSPVVRSQPSPLKIANEEAVPAHDTEPAPLQERPATAIPIEAPVEKEFLAFSPRKNSVATTGTSSSSSGTNTFTAATAVIPNPEDPPAEDEIWDEYNDLLGEDIAKGRVSTTSSLGIPFHLETYESRLIRQGKPMASPTFVADSRKASTYSRATHSTSYSADMTERIRAAFQPHPSPTVPTFQPDRTSSHKRKSQSVDLGKLAATRSARSSCSSTKTKESTVSSCSSDDGSPLAQVNLRVGSMTVSKWLTFGHVLFSDVRHELVPVEGSLKRQSILVIDSLGNDDWSFYAAETYPAANFFNLSPRAPLPEDMQTSPSSFPLSPPNHHQIQYLSHADKFPFAPQSFTCVVFRFPVAAPESYYRNILTEARRVLKPGGYIELSILDVDLNNMGNRGRRTVRRLKERVHEQQPDMSLGSTADLMVRLLGTHGFSNIKAARVGVPVASPVANGKDVGGKKKDQRSLSDMMSDHSAVADENITKMVSRVGRWWYTRCYENAAGTPTDKNIWSDKALMSECEQLGTSLKLMVCCARAPERITSV